MTEPALATRRLNKSFGALKVTQELDFQLPVGARHALIGPNGAGKTTFINLLTGVLTPSGGSIHLAGEDITGLRPEQRVKKGLARTYQINTLFPNLTPLEAVALVVAERHNVSRSWLRPFGSRPELLDEAWEILTRLGLTHLADVATKNLAYGHQRVLEIALALATQPRVLLLDEPAAGVPAQESGILYEVIAALPAEIAVLIIEHDMDLVFRFASRITVLAGGRLLREGTPAEIQDDEQVRAVYLGTGDHD